MCALLFRCRKIFFYHFLFTLVVPNHTSLAFHSEVSLPKIMLYEQASMINGQLGETILSLYYFGCVIVIIQKIADIYFDRSLSNETFNITSLDQTSNLIIFRLFFLVTRTGAHPAVTECEGDYNHDSRKNRLLWNIPIIDGANSAGSMEFSVPASIPGDFFPLQITFTSKTTYADIKINEVVHLDDDSAVPYSTETLFFAEKFEIV